MTAKIPEPVRTPPSPATRPAVAASVETAEPHPHHGLDRAAWAAAARMSGGLSPQAYIDAWSDWSVHLVRSPGRQLELMERACGNALKLTAHAAAAASGARGSAPFSPKAYDHRFTHPGWDAPPFSLWEQGFLATQDWWDAATDRMRGLRQQDSDRARFMARQLLDTVSPSNFPWLNPAILEATRDTGGRNLAEGAWHFARDVAGTIAGTHLPPPEGYRIGEDMAVTPGEVVFRNDLFELIQYAPTTARVHAEPILIVPAWIMKYYILDLSPHNSMVRYLVDQGFTVFIVSWCNPSADQADLSLDDYRMRGVMAAVDAVSAIVPGRGIHSVGYCLGGTILAIAAATMARDGDARLASITLMAAQVDFAEAGELLLFLDESQVAFLEDMMRERGYLDRPQMARAFAVIRSEDLIWSRGVKRYFLGQDDLPTDLGVWNTDTTRMPARMHSEYLRGLFLENRLSAGRFAVEGRVIALKDIAAPLFVVGTETDHVAPWRSVYKTALFTDAEMTFVLTSSGHNGGIVSEPGHAGRHYRIGRREAGALYAGPDRWIDGRAPVEGSWWPELSRWLAARSTGEGPPPGMGAPEMGYPTLGAAPGTYVHQM